MAIKKTVEVDVKAKGVSDLTKDAEKLEKELKDVEKQAKKTFKGDNLDRFNKEVKNTENAIKPVKTQLRELEDRMAAIGDVGSPEFQKLAAEAGVLRDKMNNARAAINSMSADFPKLQIGLQAFNAIGGGAQAAAGAVSILGGENEELTKSIQQLMAIQSVLNGVNSVANALSDETALGLKVRTMLTNLNTKSVAKNSAATTLLTVKQKGLAIASNIGATAMKALNFVMNMNPVFLLITGITALVGAIMWFASETETAEEENEKLNSTIDKQNAAFEKNTAIIQKNAENRRRLLKVQGATEEELHNDTLKRLQEEQTARVAEFEMLEKNIGKRRKVYRKALDEENSDLATSIKEQITADRKRYQELALQKNEYDIARQEEEKRYTDFLASEEEKRTRKEQQEQKNKLSKYKSYLNNRITARRLIEDLNQQLDNDEIEGNELKYNRLIEDVKRNENLLQSEKTKIIERYELLRDAKKEEIENKREAKEEARRKEEQAKEAEANRKSLELEDKQFKLLNELRSTESEREIAELVESYEQKFMLAQGNADLELALQESLNNDLKAIKDRSAAEDLAREKSISDQKRELVLGGLQSISDLVGAFAGESEKQQKRAFNVQKAAGIASATIETIQGASKAFVSQIIPADPTSLIRAVAAAGVATASGVARVASIAKTKFQSSGGSTSAAVSSVGGSSTGGGGSTPANFNIVGNTGVNQLAETLSSKNGEPVKAYVVASDVTTQQSLDRNKLDTASL